MGLAEDVAGAWSGAEDREAAEEAYAEHRAWKRAREVVEEAFVEEEVMSFQEAHALATEGWQFIDMAATQYCGPLFAQTQMDRAMLVTSSIPLIQKKFPPGTKLKDLVAAVFDWIPPELLFIGGILFVYLPKYYAHEDAGKKAKEEAQRAAEKEVKGETVGVRPIRAVS